MHLIYDEITLVAVMVERGAPISTKGPIQPLAGPVSTFSYISEMQGRLTIL